MWSLLSEDKYKYFQLLNNQSNYEMIMGNNKPLKKKLNKGHELYYLPQHLTVNLT